jgi:hypothetical protein
VRSTMSSRSIWARDAITLKKKRPDTVVVSIASVRLTKPTPRLFRPPAKSRRSFTLRPRLSSFHTTRVSPSRSVSKAWSSPGRWDVVPLIVSLSDANSLMKIAEIVGIGITLGTGALAGLGVEATMAARVLLWADRAALMLSTLSIGINEHRGEIIAAYGEDGRTFLKAIEIVQNATAIYGFARVALTVPQTVTRLRDAYKKIRGSGPAAKLGDDIDEVLAKADDIAHARPAGATAREGSGISTDGAPAPAGRASETAPAAKLPSTEPRVLGGAADLEGGPAVPQKGQSLDEVFGEKYNFQLTDGMRDPVKHANIVQLRRMALANMQSSGPNQPVKVVPLHYDPATTVKGDFTLAKFVTGRTPEQLAQELGVTAFAKGVRVYRLDRSALGTENLNLRGYSQSPAGKAPQLSTPENLDKWPVAKGAVQYNTAVDIPVTSAAEVRPGQAAVF